jgi:hypothetical protein
MAHQRVEVRPLIFQNSTLCGIEIHRGVLVRSSALDHVRIHGCTIADSALKKCKLFNCLVWNCLLIESEIHETRVQRSSMDSCNVTKSPLALRKFPVEVRKLIFQRCLHTCTNRSPSIIVALRCNKELYPEAIKLYYKLNYFRLLSTTVPVCKFTSANALGHVRKLLIR